MPELDDDQRSEDFSAIEDSLRKSVAVDDPVIAPVLRRWSNARTHYEIRRGPEPGTDSEAFLLVHTCTLDRDELTKYRWPESGRLITFATDTLEQMRAAIIRRDQSRGPSREP